MTKEAWKPIKGYEMVYEVSSRGAVRRVAPGKATYPGRVKAIWPDGRGYATVNLCWKGINKPKHVHKLVTEVFLGPCPDGYQVHHIDRNPANPTLSNLQYVTPAYNRAHRSSYNVGEANSQAKLTERDAKLIKYSTVPAVKMASRFNISPFTVWDIRSGKHWKHL